MDLGRREAHGVEVGVLLAIGDLLIYRHYVGAGVADIMQFPPQEITTGESAERGALYTCLVVNGVVSLLLRSWETFIVSGAALIGIDFATKYGIGFNPATGGLTQGQKESGSQYGANVMPMPNYAEDGAAYGYGG